MDRPVSLERSEERRRSPRRTKRDGLWFTAARVRPGRDVDVMDVSRGGALVETASRLLPGSRVELHLIADPHRTVIHGRVVRCHVAALEPSGGIRYRGAVAFEHDLVVPGAPVAAIEYCLPVAADDDTAPAGQPLPER